MSAADARGPVTRALFESVVWANARRLVSAVKAERDAGMDAVLAAYDEGARRRRRWPELDVRGRADEVRRRATVTYGDWPYVTAARRAVLDAAQAWRDGRPVMAELPCGLPGTGPELREGKRSA